MIDNKNKQTMIYLVTSDNLSFHILESKKDLTDTEIDEFMRKRFNITGEHRPFYIFSTQPETIKID